MRRYVSGGSSAGLSADSGECVAAAARSCWRRRGTCSRWRRRMWMRRMRAGEARGCVRAEAGGGEGSGGVCAGQRVGGRMRRLLCLVVLGADTSGGVRWRGAGEARRTRRMRSGCCASFPGACIEVLTGVAVATRAGVVSGVETTEVTFSEIPEARSNVLRDGRSRWTRRGRMGFRGMRRGGFRGSMGCYFNVMGLPIARVVGMIEGASELRGAAS